MNNAMLFDYYPLISSSLVTGGWKEGGPRIIDPDMSTATEKAHELRESKEFLHTVT